MHKIYFGAGPARLPDEVLQEMAAATINFNNSGISILELPHREAAFSAILEESDALVKELCGIGDEYHVLWLQGGGRHQFAMLPMNFLARDKTAGYINTGFWAADAAVHASYYGNVAMLASSQESGYLHLPAWPASVPDELAYMHCTTNNTIYGTQWKDIQHALPVPLIADMSSDIFSISRNFKQFDMFYAVAQKNIGAAGVTLVVIKNDMLRGTARKLPPVFSYAAQVKAASVLNTPPVAAIYSCLLTLRWIKAGGGIAAMDSANREKADVLYSELEQSAHFHCPVAKDSRSLMNIIFRGNDAAAETALLQSCTERNIEGIIGHRSVGGFRASLYNAVTKDDVAVLVDAIRSVT